MTVELFRQELQVLNVGLALFADAISCPRCKVAAKGWSTAVGSRVVQRHAAVEVQFRFTIYRKITARERLVVAVSSMTRD